MRTRRRYGTRQDGAVATLVFLHAHPDDEALLTSGTMARASAEGHRVVLAVATDGAAGLTSADFRDDLADVRARELERSAEILGTARLETWGYADSGLAGDTPGGFAAGDLDDQVTRLIDLIEAEQADVLVGYDASGGYGHPDHLRVHAVARAAAARVGETRSTRSARPLKHFEATLPREPIARAVRAAARLRLTPADFDPAEFDRAWTPSREITHRVDVRPYADAKRAAMAAHASQAAADEATRTLAVLTRIPGPAYRLLLGTEYYVEVPFRS
jgi:LmbE family N-acetylglucosaminyl deacetylase